MKQEMVNLILKDLPNQTAGVLRDYIDKTTDLEEEVQRLTELNKKRVEALDKAAREISELASANNALKAEANAVEETTTEETHE